MLKLSIRYAVVLHLVLLPCIGIGQSLTNASFEGSPQDASLPAGWTLCKQGTTPDILPGPWGVSKSASEGNTFVGLITRSDGSWESIGQRLSEPLEAGQCYQLTLDIAHDPVYAGYNQGGRLLIWLGQSMCARELMIGDSGSFDHSRWKTLKFRFTPEYPADYILLESYFPNSNNKSSRSNILIDHIRAIEHCPRT